MNARYFFEAVMMMRASYKSYFELKRKENKTSEDEQSMDVALRNAHNYTKIVDDEIARVQALLKQKGEIQ